MEVTVIFYGQLIDIMGGSSQKVVDVNDTDEVIKKLQAIQPALKDLSYVIAVNKKIIQENTLLQNDIEVVLLPPFAGG